MVHTYVKMLRRKLGDDPNNAGCRVMFMNAPAKCKHMPYDTCISWKSYVKCKHMLTVLDVRGDQW